MSMSLRFLVLGCACLLGAAGCSRSAAVVASAPVVLNVPPAPPRVISVPPEPVAPVETTTAAPQEEERPVRQARPAARPDAGARTGQAASDTATDGNDAPAAPTPAEPAAPPAPVLRTPQTADEGQAGKRVRDVLRRATELLAQVNPATLSREARTQHETARRFVEQSEQALLERNFVFASYLADKAETLARGLSR